MKEPSAGNAAERPATRELVKAAPLSVAVLFAKKDSVYKSLHFCDVWDKSRDATKYKGGLPVIAHPPCRAWGTLRHMAKPEAGEKELAVFAVQEVRRCGGILEHPKRSQLWPELNLPWPGESPDRFGGWTQAVRQFDWGYPAEKCSLLYIVGIRPSDLPPIPLILREPQFTVGTSGRRRDGGRRVGREIPKSMRDVTVLGFALWLCETAGKIRREVAA